MKTTRRIIAVSFGLLWLAGVAGAADVEDTLGVDGKPPCCFENPRFSGTCQVTPGENESCGDILAYLNNPNSIGKNYCGNTKVRGGWTSVPCEGASISEMSDTCGAGGPTK